MYLGDYVEDYTTLNFKFTTRTTAGIPSTLSSGVVKVYEGSATATEVTTGVTLSEDFDSDTGLNNVLIDLSSAAFYAIGADYSIVLTTGTVNSVDVGGEVLATFSIENRAATPATILDEVITGAAHNVTNSLGKRIRLLAEAGVYEDGLVWLDELNGTAGTTPFENGTSVNPVDALADANTLLGDAALNLHGIHVASGSTLTLVAAQENQEFAGEGWALALGGQSIAGSSFIDTTVSGISTGVPNVFRDCFINGTTFEGGDFVNCALGGTVTLNGANNANYHFAMCHHAGPAIIDFGTQVGVASIVHLHAFSGDIEIRNLGNQAADILSFSSSNGKITFAASCVSGTVNYNGSFELVNNGSGITFNGVPQLTVQGDITTVDTVADAIKVATDKLTFTDGTNVDANIQKINDAEVVGDGNATPWDGA